MTDSSIRDKRRRRDWKLPVFLALGFLAVSIVVWRLTRTAGTDVANNAADSLPARTDSLALALRTFYSTDVEAAVPLFEGAARQMPENPQRHAWLAEALRRDFQPDSSRSAARRALALDPCHSFAHQVLADVYNPAHGLDGADGDSSWAHIKEAVRCEPHHITIWFSTWGEAVRNGDTALAERSLREMLRSGLVSAPWRTHARWVLEATPNRAILVVGGDMDTFPPIALEWAEGVRQDVAIANESMLSLAWYVAWLRDRYGVPLPRDLPEEDGRVPGDSILAFWRGEAAEGSLGRPLLIAMTAGDSLARAGPGRDRITGPFWQVEPGEGSAAPDAEMVERALRRAHAMTWSGPALSPRDHSPIRRNATPHPATLVVLLAAYLMDAQVAAGDRAGARTRLTQTERFARRAGLDPAAVDKILESLRRALR